jgi:tight adherence protein C
MFTLLTAYELVKWTGYVLAGAAAFLVSRMLLKEEETRAAQENLEDLKNRKASNPLVKITRPFFTQYVVPMVRGKTFWDEQRAKYKRKLISGGLKDELTPDEFIAFKLSQIVFFPIIFLVLRIMDVLVLDNIWLLSTGVLGWFYPDIWINGRIKKRQNQIRKSMPFIVDLLALSTEAGLDFVGAIGKVVEKAKASPMVEELEQLLKEIKVGSSRAEAMREMSGRIDMLEVSSFVAILITADQMGASIGRTLRQQSEQIRNDRFVRAEKAGAAASQKILIPLVFLIVPAVMLMIFGPVVLDFMRSGQGVF